MSSSKKEENFKSHSQQWGQEQRRRETRSVSPPSHSFMAPLSSSYPSSSSSPWPAPPGSLNWFPPPNPNALLMCLNQMMMGALPPGGQMSPTPFWLSQRDDNNRPLTSLSDIGMEQTRRQAGAENDKPVFDKKNEPIGKADKRDKYKDPNDQQYMTLAGIDNQAVIEPRVGRISVEELMGVAKTAPPTRPPLLVRPQQREFNSASSANPPFQVHRRFNNPHPPNFNPRPFEPRHQGPRNLQHQFDPRYQGPRNPRHFEPRGIRYQNHFEPRPAGPRGAFGGAGRPVFVPYLTDDVVGRGLKKKELIKGVLRVNQRNYEEAYMDNPDGEQDIMILGLHDRNRALHGDVVVVKLKERDNWIVQENLYRSLKEGKLANGVAEKVEKEVKEDVVEANDDVIVVERTDTISPSSSAESEDSPPETSSGTSTSQEKSSISDSPKSEIESTVVPPKIVEPAKSPDQITVPKAPKCLIPLEESSEDEHSEKKPPSRSSIDIHHGPRVIVDMEEGITYQEDFQFIHHHKPPRYHYPRSRLVQIWHDLERSVRNNRVPAEVGELIDELSLHRTLEPSLSPETIHQRHEQSEHDHPHPSHPFQRKRSPVNYGRASPKFKHTPKKAYKTPADFPDQYVPDSCLQKVAEVVYLMEKKNSRSAVGTLKTFQDGRRNFALFSPNDSRVPRMMIPAAELPQGFFDRPQDFSKFIYIARLIDWPATAQFAKGRLYRSLGLAGEIEPETEGLLCQYDVDTKEFSHDCLAALPEDSKTWKIPEEEISERTDYRNEMVFTIDPTTARDLDDALHIKATDDGLFEVGVHIADVSYFVHTGNELDNWASNRATSVYLIHKVVPMLPRVLCEELCSLNPGVERLAFSVVWKMTDKAVILHEWFGRTIINSCCKLTYDHAQGFLDEPDRQWEENELPPITNGRSSADLSKAVHLLNKMAVQLRKKRFDNGALRIDMPKLCFNLDRETMLPIGCSVYEQKDSNRLIEEFMLMANMAVARQIHKHYPEIAVLRRHPPPNRKVLREVMELCEHLGYPFIGSSSGDLQETLIKYHGMGQQTKAIFAVLSQLCMKPMKLAIYFCTGMIEDEHQYRHYALNVPLYTHFTSPIRRYPDVMVHRLLAATLGYADAPTLGPKEIQAFCEHCNDKKYAAKTVSESSAEMFFACFVKECGPLEEKGIVMNVMDHSFDVLLFKYGIVKRVYCNKLGLIGDAFFDDGPPPTLSMCWNDAQGMMKKSITICSIVDVVLSSLPEPLKFSAVIKPCSDMDSTHITEE